MKNQQKLILKGNKFVVKYDLIKHRFTKHQHRRTFGLLMLILLIKQMIFLTNKKKKC